jgi:hypothetical protein
MLARLVFAGFALILPMLIPLRLLRPLPAQEKSGPQAAEPLPKELQPKLFTLQGKDISLGSALEQLAKQTGNRVEDRRQSKEDVKLKLDVKNSTFWQALDIIAKEADLRVSLFEKGGVIALRDGPHQVTPVCYSGLFRISFKRIDTTLMVEPEAHFCVVRLQVAWESRFQPLLIETAPESLEAQDDMRQALDGSGGGKGQAAVADQRATEVNIRLPAPQRSARALSLLKGKLAMVGPAKILTFVFDDLKEIKDPSKAPKQTQEGITVELHGLQAQSEDVWTADLVLEYAKEGPKFESFQAHLVRNEIYLEKEKNGVLQRLPPRLGFNSDPVADNRVSIQYNFGDDGAKKLGRFQDWKLVYKTPSKFTKVPIHFEFKDLQLP